MALFGIPNRSLCLSQILSNLRSSDQKLCSQIIKIQRRNWWCSIWDEEDQWNCPGKNTRWKAHCVWPSVVIILYCPSHARHPTTSDVFNKEKNRLLVLGTDERGGREMFLQAVAPLVSKGNSDRSCSREVGKLCLAQMGYSSIRCPYTGRYLQFLNEGGLWRIFKCCSVAKQYILISLSGLLRKIFILWVYYSHAWCKLTRIVWPILCDSPPGSSVHGVLQARMLEWVAMPSSRGSSKPVGQTQVSHVPCIGRQVLHHYCHPGSPPHHPSKPEDVALKGHGTMFSTTQFTSTNPREGRAKLAIRV